MAARSAGCRKAEIGVAGMPSSGWSPTVLRPAAFRKSDLRCVSAMPMNPCSWADDGREQRIERSRHRSPCAASQARWFRRAPGSVSSGSGDMSWRTLESAFFSGGTLPSWRGAGDSRLGPVATIVGQLGKFDPQGAQPTMLVDCVQIKRGRSKVDRSTLSYGTKQTNRELTSEALSPNWKCGIRFLRSFGRPVTNKAWKRGNTVLLRIATEFATGPQIRRSGRLASKATAHDARAGGEGAQSSVVSVCGRSD
ncbi:hypothetical protein J2X36_001448 [Methylobacterium sp. BE186]|nr:hypothetical protein [Methylobacterium sp. BE186]